MNASLPESRKQDRYSLRQVIGFSVLAVAVLWCGYIWAIQSIPSDMKMYLLSDFFDKTAEQAGQEDVKAGGFQYGTFGDSYGALNALFAGLAFAGLLITIWQQKKDLQATREEMQNTNREFAKQTLETSLFQYANFMHKVRPKNHEARVQRILDEVERFIGYCEDYHVGNRFFLYWCLASRSINIIRSELKEFATWRRVFDGWCKKIDDEISCIAQPEEMAMVALKYQSRLWEMLTQHERRVLFLQFAFYTTMTNPSWVRHLEAVSMTKCMARFTRGYGKESYNVLLRTLHLPGPRKNGYKIRIDELRKIMRDVYVGGDMPYELPEEAPPAP